MNTQTKLQVLRVLYQSAFFVSSFSSLPHLLVLEIDCATSCTDLAPMVPLASTLVELILGPNTFVSNLGQFSSFTSLQNATIKCDLYAGSSWTPNVGVPASLQSLQLQGVPGTTLSFDSIGTSNSLSLTSLSIFDSSVVNITSIPHTLQTLELGNFASLSRLEFAFPTSLRSFRLNNCTFITYIHPSIASCANLTEIAWEGLNFPSWIDTLPSLANIPLTSFSMSTSAMGIVTVSNMAKLICTTLPAARLQTLQLHDLGPLQLPPNCLALFTNLTTFNVSALLLPTNQTTLEGLKTQVLQLLPRSLSSLSLLSVLFGSASPNTWTMDWNWLVPRFPALTTLALPQNNLVGTFPAELMALSNLKVLDLTENRLNGTIPSNFFASMPSLNTFLVTANFLSGTIPWYGLDNLVLLDAGFNRFTSWPSIVGTASNLMSVCLEQNDLRQIPNDASFAAMPSLANLNLDSNGNLWGPVPAFWAKHSSINRFTAMNCGFQGSLPSPLPSSQLVALNLRNNQICGSIPAISVPLGMGDLILTNNSLSGGVPPSWVDLSLRGSLDLSFNGLSGALPSPFLSNISYYLQAVLLEANFFSGSLPNFTDFHWLQYLNVSNTSLKMCASNPNLSIPYGYSPVSCGLNLDVCNCPNWYSNCSALPSCSTFAPAASTVPQSPSTPPIPPTQACVQPPARPGAPPIPVSSSCPLPAPTGSFVCLNGVWTSVGSVNTTTITVPGGSTIVVNGNLSATETITISGLGTQIFVEGCAFIGPGGVVIELTQQEIEQLIASSSTTGKTLLQSQCGTDLSSVTVSTSVTGSTKSCQSVKTSNAASTRQSLTLIFSVDTSKCSNTNKIIAIIVPSVLGAVIILTVVAVVGIMKWRQQSSSAKTAIL